MLDDILDAAVNAINTAGISAFREFPERRADLKSGASVSVGADSCKCLSSGLGEYLGTRVASDGGEDVELFGRRLEHELRIEIYSPFGAAYGAAGCLRCADSLRECFGAMPSGLKALDMECGEIKADEELSCYRCSCVLHTLAFLVAESTSGETKFLDFVLKGTVDSGN